MVGNINHFSKQYEFISTIVSEMREFFSAFDPASRTGGKGRYILMKQPESVVR